MKKLFRAVGILTLGFVGFIVVLGFLDNKWVREQEKAAHRLCDAIPVGTPATIAKERAREMAKTMTDIEIRDESIGFVILSPYSPGDKVVCEAGIRDEKIVSNRVWVDR